MLALRLCLATVEVVEEGEIVPDDVWGLSLGLLLLISLISVVLLKTVDCAALILK